MKQSIMFLSFLLTFLLSACDLTSKDTCSQGDNMSNIRVKQSFDASLEAPTLTILWDTGTEKGALLPPSYFAEVILNKGSGTEPELSDLISSVSASAAQELTVTFKSLSSYLETHQTFKFRLEFPDRIRFIDCTHSGMADRYFLDVTLHFNSTGLFEKATFEQRTSLGAI